MKYLDELRPFLEEFYGGISGGREQITVEYAAGAGEEAHTFSSEDPAVIKEELAELLKVYRREDAFAGFTTVGPHRDDLVVKLDGLSAKSFGSQGQQRSCALSLKMSEGFVIRALTGKQPVALLDALRCSTTSCLNSTPAGRTTSSTTSKAGRCSSPAVNRRVSCSRSSPRTASSLKSPAGG